jgi:hypothetical protein
VEEETMAGSDQSSGKSSDSSIQWRDVPIDWEALEDAFENNAPEVHSYLHVPTGDVLRIVDGIADPQMHARIAADPNYLRIEPVSSREQYRWMERYIPMVDDKELQSKLTRAIDGKGAFRRFKDVLMGYGPERERWFAFRSERLRIFMEAWLNAHALNPVKRPVWVPDLVDERPSASASPSAPARESRERRGRSAESLRRQLRDIIEALGPRELDNLAAFGEFLRSRRASRSSQAGRESRPRDSGAGSNKDQAPPTEKAHSAPRDEASSGRKSSKGKGSPRSDKVPAKRASGD